MFIANLMASVLALAMVGASTASVSKFENNAVRSAENTSFVASPKRAYYDPSENYGHTEGRAYFYTENVNTFVYRTGTWETVATLPNGSIVSCAFGISSDGMNVIQYREIGQYNPTYFTNEASSLDVYLDGIFAYTITPQNSSDLLCYSISATSLEINNTNHYLWVFDHQEAEPYTPVDILGDIAEGLTGGIVPVAEGIGSGLQSLVQDIFLNADHDGLSVFGIVTICFAGLALALGLSRWVLNFVDSLGARDR